MLWKIAIHGGHLHPDFIRGKLTDKQIHEIAWYYELYPFGHDIDHSMFAMMISSLAGGKPVDYMPKISKPMTTDEMISGMAGLSGFMSDQDINLEEEE
jgi:hypothetical protein